MFLFCAYFLLGGVMILFFRYSFWRKFYFHHMPCKRPHFFNILGEVAGVLQSKDIHTGLLNTAKILVEQFKKEQLFCVWFLYEPVVICSRANAVKELLADNKFNERGWVYERLRPLLGTGLILSEGERWKSRRKLLTPCFHQNILRSFVSNFNNGAQRLVSTLQRETMKEFTFIEHPVKFCALDIICETIFGVKINTLQKEFTEYFDSMTRLENIFMLTHFKPWVWPYIIFWNTESGKEYRHCVNAMHKVTRKILREKKERYLRGEIDIQQGNRKALMDLLLEKHFETGELSQEDIRSEVDTFTIAGYETVATSIEWALYLIGLHADVQAKLHEEIDQIFGGDMDREVTERVLQDLQYLDCVLKESNRLYPTVPLYVRQAIADTTICGYFIPKGTTCLVATYLLHKDEDVFPDPEAFKPERFLPENSADIPSGAYNPFGSGPRKCIGYKFAEMEMKVIVASILRSFTIKSLDDRSKIQTLAKITLQPSIPIRIKFRYRFPETNS